MRLISWTLRSGSEQLELNFDFPLHDAARSQISPLHFAAGSQISPLYHAAGESRQ
jgi:hypothetical protein